MCESTKCSAKLRILESEFAKLQHGNQEVKSIRLLEGEKTLNSYEITCYSFVHLQVTN